MNTSASNSNKFQDEPQTPDVTDGMGEFPMSQSFMNLSLEEQEIKKEEWRKELAEVEYEIQTMRQVLTSKLRKSSELKRKLGITAWGEFSNDISQGLRNVKETSTFQTIEEKVEEVSKAISSAPLYQKTETALKTTAEKTTTFLGGITGGLSAKIGAVKNSDTFRSMEERVGSVYTNVKSKVVTSRSSSSHELDEALKEAEAQREAANSGGLTVTGSSSTATPTTTPTQLEKPVA
ncbi:tumor protein D54-like isoform X1 [Daphnia pulex]|uniref:tumor protein D54-like isoform X1 n=1 Tax=Daphnia pulex TaxID=6669 RepID=UPI001EDE7BA1|nr:tumor protein D54-like isoform X1 [Daphnia pulex]XP_046635641.1 tumor protein D54-like isoform X1 [Daphnia pulicaria]